MSIICVTYTSERLAAHTSKFVCEKYAAAKISSNHFSFPTLFAPSPSLSRVFTWATSQAGFVKDGLPVS